MCVLWVLFTVYTVQCMYQSINKVSETRFYISQSPRIQQSTHLIIYDTGPSCMHTELTTNYQYVIHVTYSVLTVCMHIHLLSSSLSTVTGTRKTIMYTWHFLPVYSLHNHVHVPQCTTYMYIVSKIWTHNAKLSLVPCTHSLFYRLGKCLEHL